MSYDWLTRVLFTGVTVAFLTAVDAQPPPLPKDTLPAQLELERVPAGLDPKRPIPIENPLTPAKVQLGRRLFFDPVLSQDRSLACASCHLPERGFSSPDARAIGIKRKLGARNAPTLFNVAYGSTFFWDGRVSSLEAQALLPIESTNELGSDLKVVVKRLQSDESYVALFKKAFDGEVSSKNIAKAIASFERTLLLGNSPVDQFHAGNSRALTLSEKQGLWLFESRGHCWRCHTGANFTDGVFHNTGVSWKTTPADSGRFNVSHNEKDRGAFKTPTLRGVALTAPYMHNGSIETLEDVVRFYNRGGVLVPSGRIPDRNLDPNLDPIMKPLNLTEDDIKNLAAFLKALSNPASSQRLE